MPSKPKDYNEVKEVMLKYCKEKQFNFTDKEIDFMAENCYLTFESKEWKGISFWPAIAKRWVLNNKPKKSQTQGWFNVIHSSDKSNKPKSGKTVRDIILEQKKDEQIS